MTTAIVTPPAMEPLHLDEVKAHLRIDGVNEDALLMDLLQAARAYVEAASGQKLMSQVWRQYADYPGIGQAMRLELAPVREVQAITFYDAEGMPRPVAPGDVTLVRTENPAELIFTAALDPSLARNGIEIDVLCGFGDLGVDVPDTLKRAILLLVAHWYEFRGAVPPSQQPVSLPPGFEALMMPWRRVRL